MMINSQKRKRPTKYTQIKLNDMKVMSGLGENKGRNTKA